MEIKYNEFGKVLKKLRKENKISQLTLGMESGYTNAFISRIEKDKVNPSIRAVEDILNSMGYKMTITIEKETEHEGVY